MRNLIRRFSARVVALSTLSLFLPTARLVADHPLDISVPEGFEVQLAAAAPLVTHPMMGCFDDRGRLFLAESAGRNLNEMQLDELRPNSIRMLEDTDGDGVFDRHTVFAYRLAIPNGALWLAGSLYVAEPPGIWRFTDTDDDGVADVREHIAGNVKSNGMSSTLHGPTLHPSGRLFWCGGQQGYRLDRHEEPPKDIARFTERHLDGIRSPADGVDFVLAAIGQKRENPWRDSAFGTVAILDFPDGARHDALMHWVFGGLYASSNNVPAAIHQTGPRLPPLSHVGQVAPAGIERYRSDQFGAEFRDNLFWAQFNTHTVVRTTLEPNGATYAATDQDFAVCEHVDFHPTDVIEDADGSLLIIDTGGWFRHGCPTSRIARPEALGVIYRVRRTGSHQVKDPRGIQMPWKNASAESLVERLNDPRPAVVERATERWRNTHSPKAF